MLALDKEPQVSTTPAASTRRVGFQVPAWLMWLLVPLLAAIAYAPVLTMWFVADDFNHLRYPERLPGLAPFATYGPDNLFYRPLSAVLTWNLGHALFGTEALGYHAMSLLLHALCAWLLGRAVLEISGEARIGWLAGALFAVYPLPVEAVAWLASQWDLWAAACALAAVWGFAGGWRTGSMRPYLAGLAAAFAGVFMKEGALTLPLVLPFVAIATELGSRSSLLERVPQGARGWAALAPRILLWSLPFALPSLLFAGLRLVAGGSIGGYAGASRDYQDFFWDAYAEAGKAMLAPLNRSVFNPALAQVVGMAMSGLLLVGLALWGSRRRHLLLLALAWAVVFLLPALNIVLLLDESTLQGNRVLYLGLGGFCMALAVLLGRLVETVERAGKWRVARWLPVALVALCMPATWLQLWPWQQASRQARHIAGELEALVYPLPGRRVHLKVMNLPRQYKGAYVYWNGLEDAMTLFTGRQATVDEVQQLDPTALIERWEKAGVYNLAFDIDQASQLFYVSEMAGVTVAAPPPPSNGQQQTWDYTGCGKGGSPEVQPISGSVECLPSGTLPPIEGAQYARFTPGLPNGGLIMANAELALTGASWVRLAVAARLPEPVEGPVGEWFWQGDGQSGWSGEESRSFRLDPRGEWRTYWTYVPASEIGSRLTALRFDPINGHTPVEIAWLSVSAIKW